jgi:hypothetical protein
LTSMRHGLMALFMLALYTEHFGGPRRPRERQGET